MGARNFRNYQVWQESVDFATYIYSNTQTMPWFEKKGLCDQMQRAAVSISSNIAEGAAKESNFEFAHFLEHALGSAFEVETQLHIAKNIGYMEEEPFQEILTKVTSIERQINALVNTVKYTQIES